jgi:hypothetical protein
MLEPNLEDVFPGLRGQPYQIASPRDHRYNCIAFAAGDEGNWWWPDAAEEDTWPSGVARAETVEAFRDASTRWVMSFATTTSWNQATRRSRCSPSPACFGTPPASCPAVAGSANLARARTLNTGFTS